MSMELCDGLLLAGMLLRGFTFIHRPATVWMVAPAARIKEAGAKAMVSNSQGAVKAAMDQVITASGLVWQNRFTACNRGRSRLDSPRQDTQRPQQCDESQVQPLQPQ